MEIERYSSGAPLEKSTGYSRMIKVAGLILIGGTTSVQSDGTVYGDDAYSQTRYVLEKQVQLLERAGGKKENVIAVDAFIVHMSDTAEIGRAYSEIFHDVRPTFTVVGTTELNRPTQLVEIKLMAVTNQV